MCGSPSRPCYDAFVATISPDGGTLVNSTYFGGSGDDNCIDGCGGIAVDESGYVFISGQTASTNFLAVNALQQTYGGGATDAFLAQFSPDGLALIFSTYLGGNGDDTCWDTKLDLSGNIRHPT